MSNFDTIIRQRRRIEKLEEEVRQLRALDVNGILVWGARFTLTKLEAQFLELLVSRELVTHEAAIVLIFNGDHLSTPDKLAQIYIHKLRKKLKRFGFRINTIWGVGWRIPATERSLLAGMKKEFEAANDTGLAV